MYNFWTYLVILLLRPDTLTFGILFEYRLRCPDTPEKWRENTDSYICHGDKVYHCMQDQDGRYVVFCAPSIWIQPDYCPEFNEKSSLIDVILCQGAVETCPGSIYLSNTVYQYPSCFRKVITRYTTESHPYVNGTVTVERNPGYKNTGLPKQDSGEERNSKDSFVIIGILLGIFLPILVFLAIIFIVNRRKQKRKKKASTDREEKDSLLKDSTIENSKRETRNEASFVKPGFYGNALKTLKEDGFIIIVGGSGSGKTTLANYIAKTEFKDNCVHHMKPKQTELPELSINKGEVVLWDDCFGIWNICDLEEKMKVGVRNTILDLIDRCKNKENYAIICIDSFFDESGMFDQLGKTVISLTENYDSFYEREKVCRSFDKKIYVKEVSKEVGFPLLIALILEHHCPIEKAEDFMKNPIEYLRSNFNNLYKNGKNLYVTLVYVLCNSPSVNLKEIRWRKWKKLREEFQKSKDGENNISQQGKSNQDCQGEEDDLLSDDSMIISSNPKGIEMNTTLAKYLVKTEDPNVYAFRHHFLAHLFLCHHVEKVGNQGILEVGNDEIRSIVKKLQPPLFNSTPVQSGKV